MSSNNSDQTTSKQITQEQENAYRLVVKFGFELMQGNFTSIPNFCLDFYQELGLTPLEMMFIIHVWHYWYKAKRDAFPALTTIASKMGVSRRQAQTYPSNLKQKQYKDGDYVSKPYLQVTERYAEGRGQLSSVYDFSGFLEAVVYLAKKNGQIPEEPPQQFSSRGGMQNSSRGGEKKTSTEEYEDEKDKFEKDENLRKANALKIQKEGVKGNGTYSRVEHGTIRNENTRVGSDRNHKPNGKANGVKQPVYVGKPLTQDEIDENKRQSRNASGFTPLSNIIPTSHWQELQTQLTPITTINGLHYNHTTKNAPVSIDAIIGDFTNLLHDEEENTAQNINRAAKLHRETGLDETAFTNLLYEVFHAVSKNNRITKRRADGMINKMPYFFRVLEKRLKKPPN